MFAKADEWEVRQKEAADEMAAIASKVKNCKVENFEVTILVASSCENAF